MDAPTETQLKLLAAAEATLLEVGWDAASASLIRKRITLSNGSLFHAFPGGKIQIAVELFMDGHAVLWDGTLAELCASPGPDHRHYNKVIRRLVVAFEKDPEKSRLYFLLLDALLRHPEADAVRARLNEDECRVATWLRGVAPNWCPAPALCMPVFFGSVLATARVWVERSAGATSLSNLISSIAVRFKPLMPPPYDHKGEVDSEAQEQLVLC